MKDSKLPTAVLKGKLGMAFPEYQPMDSDDSLDVDIPMYDEIAAAMETGVEDGGVTTITHQPMQKDGGVHNNSTKTKPQLSSNNETANTFKNTLGVKENTTTVQDGGATPVTPTKTPIDMEMSDISDDDMMMMTDDPVVDEVLLAARQETQVQFPREETMSIRKSSRESKRPRFHDESPVKVTKETIETSVGDIRASSQTALPRRLPQRKELPTRPPSQRVKRKVRFGVDHRSPEHRTVGDLNVSTARRLICHAQLEHKASVEDFPIGKLHFDCRKALQSKYGDLFKASIAKEMKAINEFKVMHPVTRDEIPANTKVFNSYMICHRKSLGHPDWKCKSRLIVDGSNTTPGVHTTEMDIPTAMPRWNAVRLQ